MSVIFSRAPLRISLGGGGTDLPSYYREHGGFLVAGAIDKYIYMLMHTVFQRRYKMKYSETEDVEEIADDPASDPARDARCATGAGSPLEIASVADVPAGTGMGSSGAFTVACSRGWPTLAGPRSPRARWPNRRARSRSTSSTSRAASRTRTSPRTAGSAPTRSTRTGRVTVEPLELVAADAARAARADCCCSTRARPATPRPSSPTRTARTKTGDDEMLENIHRTKEIGLPEP